MNGGLYVFLLNPAVEWGAPFARRDRWIAAQPDQRRDCGAGIVLCPTPGRKRRTRDECGCYGMGEPFNNYDNVMEALNRLNHPDGFGLGARRITLSTVGLVPQINGLQMKERSTTWAISLHTVDNDLRSSMIPVNLKYSVEELLSACRYYVRNTRRRVTFEYALIDGVNDSTVDAEKLALKLRGLLCHVNLIPLNPTQGYGEQGSDANKVDAFSRILETHHIPCTVRVRRGIEIQAGLRAVGSGS